MTPTLDDLISRLEKAPLPDRELDDDIYAAMNGYKKVSGMSVDGCMLEADFWLTGAPDNVICGQVIVGRSPIFTFDISAARALIESGMLFSVEGNAGDYQQGRYGKARVWCAPEYSGTKSMARIDVNAVGATPAIALCIVALKARVARYES